MPNPIQILNGNDPVDIGAILCRGMMEFFVNHMPEATVKTQYGNFMAAVEEMLLSPEGIKYVRLGFDRLGEILSTGINDELAQAKLRPFDPNNEIERSEARMKGVQAAIKKTLEDMP